MVNVRTNFNRARQRLDRLSTRGQYALAHQVNADSNLYAPRLTGQLRIESIVSNDNKSITWRTPYARRQYYADGTWNYTTPGTGPKWDQKAKSIHLANWMRIIVNELR